ncbi:MAG TPA: ATP-binding protein, partial [Candidatus Megaira endosymbiont of Nemacystus decipiens]|nr:ATP-binding protein [Candidatus Megaera endosymbiont of Nemacystus decipiens]
MGLDIAIIVGFLILTLGVGIYNGQSVTNIRDFALGGRNFNTMTLVATIVATWASGDDFFVKIFESHKNGLYFIGSNIPGVLIVLLVIGLVFVPRMAEFLGDLTIAESMGKMYGNKVRLITAIAGCIGASGMVAVQFKIAGVLLEYSLGISGVFGIISGAIIVTAYSSFGGIKSVTFTDLIQFFMFCAIIPTLAFFIYGTFENSHQIPEVLSHNDNFDLTKILNFTSERSLYYLFLFLFMIIPSFDPAIFQRISMSKNILQARKAFVVAALSYAFFGLFISWIGIIAIAIYPDVDSSLVAQRILTDYSYSGLRGLTIAGILAMLMSSADSYINSTSVMFTYDFFKASGIKINNQLLVSRVTALVLGLFSLFLALYSKGLLELMIKTKSFYMPVVSVPFMFSIFGFRSSSKSVLIGMLAGVTTVIFCELFMSDNIISAVPGMFMNAIFLFASHYFLKQEGGWVGIKNYGPLEDIKKARKESLNGLIADLKNFSVREFLTKNTPKNSSSYLCFGIFSLFSTYFSTYTIPQTTINNYPEIVNLIYPPVLFLSTALVTYPIWGVLVKNTNAISYLWIFSLFYILMFVGFTQILISDFSKFQLIAFILNFVVLSILARWQMSIIMMLVASFLSLYFFSTYTGKSLLPSQITNIQFTISYLLLLMSTILLTFLRPKQEYHEQTESKMEVLKESVGHLDDKITLLENQAGEYQQKINNLNETIDHYSRRISDQVTEIERLGSTAEKILNNVNHELRLPVGNVINFSQMLYDGLGKYSQDQLKELSDEVYQNSTRLSSMILNMLDLATLDVKRVDLSKSTENFGELVRERVKACCNVYLQKKPINFNLLIEPEILIPIDSNYIRQVIDNLVINAINFSKKGTIEVELKKHENSVTLVIRDEGIGIPKQDLFDIFTPFKMGSNTATKAEGRGVGLALCKSAIEAHGGSIIAESPGSKGAVFTVTLPIK